jgi:hypothetical protein
VLRHLPTGQLVTITAISEIGEVAARGIHSGQIVGIISEFEGLSLTVKILELLGFLSDRKSPCHMGMHVSFLDFALVALISYNPRNTGWGWEFTDSYGNIFLPVHFLHTLQNLFNILTGQELRVTEVINHFSLMKNKPGTCNGCCQWSTAAGCEICKVCGETHY